MVFLNFIFVSLQNGQNAFGVIKILEITFAKRGDWETESTGEILTILRGLVDKNRWSMSTHDKDMWFNTDIVGCFPKRIHHKNKGIGNILVLKSQFPNISKTLKWFATRYHLKANLNPVIRS